MCELGPSARTSSCQSVETVRNVSLEEDASQAAKVDIAAAVALRRQARWLDENRNALDSSNTFVEQHGLPLSGYRHSQTPARQGALMTTPDSTLIHCDSRIMGGVAVFVGSRLPVATLLACVDAGNSWARIVASWPWLTPDHLDAARDWAATQSRRAIDDMSKAADRPK